MTDPFRAGTSLGVGGTPQAGTPHGKMGLPFQVGAVAGTDPACMQRPFLPEDNTLGRHHTLLWGPLPSVLAAREG